MTQLLLPIAPAKRAKAPSEPIVRTASLEYVEVGRAYRWTMTRGWASGPTIVWVLLNPSTADGKQDDPTTLRMMGFSYRWGFGSMIVANVYPLISSTTDRLHRWRRTFDHETYEANGMQNWSADKSSWSAFHHNQGVISALLTEESVCVAAWGNGINDADLDHFLRGVGFMVNDDEFGQVGVCPKWSCLGTTKSGAPIHPLARGRHRVPDEATLTPWRSP